MLPYQPGASLKNVSEHALTGGPAVAWGDHPPFKIEIDVIQQVVLEAEVTASLGMGTRVQQSGHLIVQGGKLRPDNGQLMLGGGVLGRHALPARYTVM
jgi:hypothetical protein